MDMPKTTPKVSSFGVVFVCEDASWRDSFVGTTFTERNTKGKTKDFVYIALIADKLRLQLKSDQVANF